MSKVFLNSLPKSGTNLMRRCLELMGYEKVGSINSSKILRRSIGAISRNLFWSLRHQKYQIGIDTNVTIPKSVVNEILGRARENSIVTAHVGFDRKLVEVLSELQFKSIVIIRDPRAVLSSFERYISEEKSKHFLNRIVRKKSKKERIKFALRGGKVGKIKLLSLSERCREIQKFIEETESQVIKFEDLVGEKGGGKKEVQEKKVQEIMNYLEIKTYRAKDISEKIYGGNTHTFRVGRIDFWKEDIPKEMMEIVEKELNQVLKMWKY